jgi:phosphoribosylformylglycinamidine cyclo-ligase
MALTYRQAGVDTDKGDSLVERIKPFAKATRTPHVLGDVGGFAGLCRVPSDISEPVLVSGTDGVGTKLKVAFATGVHDTIGQDLVAMCVNDILTCGATPLFFLDYFATGALDVDVAEAVVRGIAEGCTLAGCALLGGETAELPGMYAAGEYDLAGFAVGVVGKARIVDGSSVGPGDVAIALPSSGLHSNGYSLARRVLFERGSLGARPASLGGQSVGQALLTPTRIYAAAVRAALAAVPVGAMCHVTGGGLPGNLPRVLPEGLGVRVTGGWSKHPIFELIANEGPVEVGEMRATFNDGVGYVFVVRADDEAALVSALRDKGEAPFRLGTVVEMDPTTPFEARVAYGAG